MNSVLGPGLLYSHYLEYDHVWNEGILRNKPQLTFRYFMMDLHSELKH